MNAREITQLDTPALHGHGRPDPGLPHPGLSSAEAVATSRDHHHWGRAMAVAIGKLADKLATEEGHEALLGRELRLRITEDPEGVRIEVWCLPEG
jgi:hypothetical protein